MTTIPQRIKEQASKSGEIYTQARDMLSTTSDSIKEAAGPIIDDISTKAAATYNTSRDSIATGIEGAEMYAREYPAKALLIAVAAGFIAGSLLMRSEMRRG